MRLDLKREERGGERGEIEREEESEKNHIPKQRGESERKREEGKKSKSKEGKTRGEKGSKEGKHKRRREGKMRTNL